MAVVGTSHRCSRPLAAPPAGGEGLRNEGVTSQHSCHSPFPAGFHLSALALAPPSCEAHQSLSVCLSVCLSLSASLAGRQTDRQNCLPGCFTTTAGQALCQYRTPQSEISLSQHCWPPVQQERPVSGGRASL